MAWLVAGLRRWRDDGAASVAVAALVLVSALVLGLAPRLLDRVAADALRSTVGAASQASRGLQLQSADRVEAGPSDPLGQVVAEGAALERRLPPSIRALVHDRTLVVDTPRFAMESVGTQPPTLVTLRIQPGALDRVRMVQGRAPTGSTRSVPDPTGETSRPVFEVALSSATAAKIGANLGDTIGLTPDPRDPLGPRFMGPSAAAAADVVGIFDVADPGDPFWFGDRSLARPGIRAFSEEIQYVDATFLAAPAAYPALLDASGAAGSFGVPAGGLFRVAWRLDVDPARVTSSDAEGLLADLRRLSTLFPAAPTDGSAAVTVQTDLTRVVGGHVARWRSATLILSIAAVGTAAVGLAALALVAMLAVRRRRATVVMWLGRGASRLQLVGVAASEAVLIALPPAVIALALAVALVPGGPTLPSLVLCGVVAIATVALLVGIDLPTVIRPPGVTGSGGGRGARRGAVEATIVLLAIAGTVVLRLRTAPEAAGVAGVAGSIAGPDPFAAAVPALVGLAAGLVAARAFRYPMRALGAVAARRRDLVPVLAFRRSTRGTTAAAMLLVLMATATIATFSAAVLAHLDQAGSAIAWQEVGADLRVTAPTDTFPTGVDLSRAPGVVASAPIYAATVPLGVRGAAVDLVAVDPARLERVTSGTPADPVLPDALSSVGPGPIPAIVSTSTSGPAIGVRVGDTFDLSVSGKILSFRAIEARATFPTVPLDTPAFVVASRPLVEAAIGRALPTTTETLRAPAVAAEALARSIAPQLPDATVTGRAETEAATRHSPIADAAATGVVLAAVVAALYAATALLATLALASAARATESAHLRTLGLSTRESTGLVVVEYLPAVAVAFIGGAALGLGLFVLVEPGLGLGGLLGSTLTVPFRLEPEQLLALLAVTAAATAISMAVGAALERRAALAASIRRGIA